VTLVRYQPCAKPGCPTIVERGLCLEHRRKERRASDKRTGRIRGSRWAAIRREVFKRSPLCQDGRVCGGKASAVEVDHIKPLFDGGHATNLDNLQGICSACHLEKSAEEQRGQQDYRRKLNGG